MMTECGTAALNMEGCTIYIVDDDTSLCRALARLLKCAGYPDVRTFSSAEDFILGVAPSACSLMILDLQLPGMSGLDLLETLRRSGHLTPAILISAHDEELMRAKSMNHDRAAFLHKPFEERDLISVISSLAPR